MRPYKPISDFELHSLVQRGGFDSMKSLVKSVKSGDLIEVLNTYGEIKLWYVLELRDFNPSRYPGVKEVVARDSEGLDFILNSSMGDCYDFGWRFARKEELARFWSSISSLSKISDNSSTR